MLPIRYGYKAVPIDIVNLVIRIVYVISQRKVNGRNIIYQINVLNMGKKTEINESVDLLLVLGFPFC